MATKSPVPDLVNARYKNHPAPGPQVRASAPRKVERVHPLLSRAFTLYARLLHLHFYHLSTATNTNSQPPLLVVGLLMPVQVLSEHTTAIWGQISQCSKPDTDIHNEAS